MYKQICEFTNIYQSFGVAVKGRRYAPSVLKFSENLEVQLLKIRSELINSTFTPSPYNHFTVYEPKERHIAAPAFRDIVVQHAIFNIINPVFEKHFIFDNYACRQGKGTHFGVFRIKKFLEANRSIYGQEQPVYFLKCDISKFFQNIHWDILQHIIERSIDCPKTASLLEKIITIHITARKSMNQNLEQIISLENRQGLPIGNLTSQLFANIYMNELDHFIKEKLKARWYGRYMDDFLIISTNKELLKFFKAEIAGFCANSLGLALHPNKTFIGNAVTGIDFLGYRVFRDHILVRAKTLRKMQKRYNLTLKELLAGKISQDDFDILRSSFEGHLKQANTFGLKEACFEYKSESEKISS